MRDSQEIHDIIYEQSPLMFNHEQTFSERDIFQESSPIKMIKEGKENQ